MVTVESNDEVPDMDLALTGWLLVVMSCGIQVSYQDSHDRILRPWFGAVNP